MQAENGTVACTRSRATLLPDGEEHALATSQDPTYITSLTLAKPGTQVRAEKNLRALRDVLEQLPDSAHLTFVGDGPLRQELEEHFAGCRVTFTVRVSRHDTAHSVFREPADSMAHMHCRASWPQVSAAPCL